MICRPCKRLEIRPLEKGLLHKILSLLNENKEQKCINMTKILVFVMRDQFLRAHATRNQVVAIGNHLPIRLFGSCHDDVQKS